MSTFAAPVVLGLLLAPAAPIPPERRVPTVKLVLWASTGASMGPNAKNAAERAESFRPRLKAYVTIDEVAKEFANPEDIKKRLAEKFNPNCHVILFARWDSLFPSESIEPTVDNSGRVVFLYRFRLERSGCGVGIPREERNVVYVIDKNARWALAEADEESPKKP